MNLKSYPKTIIARIVFIFIFVDTFTFLALKLPHTTSAASLDAFRPGNIISDYVMSPVLFLSLFLLPSSQQ